MRSAIAAIVLALLLGDVDVSQGKGKGRSYVLIGGKTLHHGQDSPNGKPTLFKTEQEGNTAIVRFVNPRVNAFNETATKELTGILLDYDQNDSVHSIVVTGDGKNFISGGDLKVMSQADGSKALQVATDVHNLLLVMEQLDKPVLAAINGNALGGGSQIALSADARIAANVRDEDGKPIPIIGQPERKAFSTLPGFGGTQRLARVIGTKAAMDAMLSGARYTAKQAKRLGWVDLVVEPDALMQTALEQAKRYEGPPEGAVGAIKRSTYGIWPGSPYLLNLENELKEFKRSFDSSVPQKHMGKFLHRGKN